ncbi:glycosyltransferase [Flavobacterium difficile]|uniref:Glycosyltransferase n=1 Tax=Flavobacterium difficile TaxID=2709659 RepID=A0ABX0I3I8_9FLAO|nr:glycosyltransferase [Flavobacterium difficile]NHM01142.1 glycosyltransferase [Flavobacterium difficile]
MRIVQLIDSLDTGGAERMAVTYANALSNKIAFSGIVATRKEGLLLDKIKNKANYLFLNKKGVFDIAAIFSFRKYCVQHNIGFIHAHSSSFFLAVLVKLTLPRIKIIWHDHYGNSEFLQERKFFVLKICSLFFDSIVVVNQLLLEWNLKKMFCKKVSYLRNFPEIETVNGTTKLNGEAGKRIVCLANVRPQKNLEMLVEVANQLSKLHPEWTFHIVGKKFHDSYLEKITLLIASYQLENRVFLYGSKNDVSNVLKQSSIGILTSSSEGLPVSLLEYGLSKLPVIATNVGEIREVIIPYKTGFLIESNDTLSFVNKLTYLIENPQICANFANELYVHIQKNYSKDAIINHYLKLL